MQQSVDWIREHLPESLLGRVLLLEIWQWLALLVLAFAGVAIDRTIRLFLGKWLLRLLVRSDLIRKKQLETDFERPIGILAAAGVWVTYRLVDLVAAHCAAQPVDFSDPERIRAGS